MLRSDLVLRLFVLVACLFQVLGAYAQQKRIYIANDDHTDYLWSADERTYERVFLHMLDYYIRKADSTIAIGLPGDLQSRFNCDGSIWLWVFEKNRTREQVAGLINKIRSRHISVPFNALVSTYGGAPAEAVLRGMYYAGSLERRYDLDLNLAVAMEDQTHPLGLASLWAGAGARYSWKGVCGCTSEFRDMELASRAHEVYWYTGLDGRRILMKWYSLNDTIPPGGRDKNESLGGYAEARNPSYAVAACKRKFSEPHYRAFNVAGAFGYGWDELQTYNADGFIAAARGGTDSVARVIVSNEQDFFEDLELTHGSSLAAQTVSFGNEWDVLCASLAETSAKVKRSLEKLRSAEAMAVLIARFNAGFGSSMDSARMKAWMGYGLYWEHDLTTDNLKIISARQRAAWQRKIEGQITDYTDALFDSALAQMGKYIAGKRGTDRFFVFNPLSWPRTDYADYRWTGDRDVIVNDLSTGAEVPHQIVTAAGVSYLRILASDIPSVGYKVFEIHRGRGKPFALAAALTLGESARMENSAYKVTMSASGTITSLIDKGHGNRECIGMGGANDLGTQSLKGRITLENSGPVSLTLKAESSNPLLHTTRITLYRDIARVDIDNMISENFPDVRKWKFAFNLKAPETWHEEVGAVIKARLASHGGHYSDVNASYKYQTLNHFVSLNEKSFGITLSNRDCYFMQLGSSSFDRLDESATTLNVLAGGRGILPDRGIPDQDGDTLFTQRFALGTHGEYDEAHEMKFAMEHQNPFVAGTVTGESARLPGKDYSYLSIDASDVLLWALKPAEEGYSRRGVIVRLWNCGEKTHVTGISFNSRIRSAYQASHVETDIGANPYFGFTLKAIVPAKAINTYRAEF